MTKLKKIVLHCNWLEILSLVFCTKYENVYTRETRHVSEKRVCVIFTTLCQASSGMLATFFYCSEFIYLLQSKTSMINLCRRSTTPILLREVMILYPKYCTLQLERYDDVSHSLQSDFLMPMNWNTQHINFDAYKPHLRDTFVE